VINQFVLQVMISLIDIVDICDVNTNLLTGERLSRAKFKIEVWVCIAKT